MNYELIFESSSKVVITDGTVTFHIAKVYIDKEGEKGKLVSVEINNDNSDFISVDLYIPHIFPTGHHIDIIGSESTNDPNVYQIFNKIVISNGITIEASAFEMVIADEVVWPDDCYIIPHHCFFLGIIGKISNIDHVTCVGDYAFARTALKRINWPKECPIIPKFCFWDSGLEVIEGIEAIKDIEESAFHSTHISMLDLSKTKISYLKQGSLFGIPDSCKVAAPYYTSSEELQIAREKLI